MFMERWRPFAISMGVAMAMVSILYLALPVGLDSFLLAPRTVDVPTTLPSMVKRTIGVWIRHPAQILVFLPLLLLVVRWRPEYRHWIPFLLILMLTLPDVMVGHDLVMDNPIYRKRALIWTLVPFCILAALAFVHVGRAKVIIAAATVAVLAFLSLNAYVAVSELGVEKSDWGLLARDVREQKAPGDAVLYCPRFYGHTYRYYEYPEQKFNEWPKPDRYYTWYPDWGGIPQPIEQQPDIRPFNENDRVWMLISLAESTTICNVDSFHGMLVNEGFRQVEHWQYDKVFVRLYEKGEPAIL